MKKENKLPIPNSDIEYIYHRDGASKYLEDSLCWPIKPMQIVTNVKIVTDRRGYERYQFTLKESGETMYTDSYFYFYENCVENEINFKLVKKLKRQRDKLDKEIEALDQKIRRL